MQLMVGGWLEKKEGKTCVHYVVSSLEKHVSASFIITGEDYRDLWLKTQTLASGPWAYIILSVYLWSSQRSQGIKKLMYWLDN